VALGSTNGYRGPSASVLYGIDSTQKTLVKIDWTTGSIDTVAFVHQGGNPIPIGPRCGFDISAVTGVAYLASESGSGTALSSVNLTTGEIVGLSAIGPSDQPPDVVVKDIATLPPTNIYNISTRSRVGTGDEVMIAEEQSRSGLYRVVPAWHLHGCPHGEGWRDRAGPG
jgi:Domain of unknown function (DUF4394)